MRQHREELRIRKALAHTHIGFIVGSLFGLFVGVLANSYVGLILFFLFLIILFCRAWYLTID